MSKTLYLECYSGISGDMTVASLLDLGADEDALKKVLSTVPAKGFDIKISRKKAAGLDVCDFDVLLETDNHDHDMNYLYGEEHAHHDEHEHGFDEHAHPDHTHEEAHCHDHHHEEDHHHDHDYHHDEMHDHDRHHDHEHEHTSAHEHHHHEHRNLNDVLQVIDKTDMTDNARKIAVKIFRILAEAEAKAHGVPIDEVHFHEVGAIDSIVDIISAAVCIDNLGITECIVPVLYEGQGFVHCQHGDMPVPVPATVNITSAYDITLHRTDMEGELVTPTGAAIVAALKTGDVLPERYSVMATGLGAGKRAYRRPSILRAMIIEPKADPHGADELIYKLESNIDDCPGEALGYCMERLFEAGARDVHYIPCFMKKNRPGYVLTVICTEDDIPQMEQIIFEDTTTIGIRRSAMERSVLKRAAMPVKTSYGDISAKQVILPNGKTRVYPEYESIVGICRSTGRPYMEIYNAVAEQLWENS